MSAIKLTIDGHVIEAAPGTTILEAARGMAIDIPTFCHDPELTRNGACRICVVEVEKARALVASCCAPVGPDMVVHTASERVVRARISILNLMLANHPLDCITCEKTGQCKLQDYCYHYGVSSSLYSGETKELPLDDTNLYFSRDMNKCVLCGRCVGKCQEINGAGAIDFTRRGFLTNVGPAFGDPIEESACVFCGMCIDTCPVGALIPKAGVGLGRPWEVSKVRAICPNCDTGCAFYLHAREGKVIGVSPDPDSPVNRGHLCVKGRFGWEAVNSPRRLTRPLIRRDGVFAEAGWDEALELVAAKLSEGKERYGADAVAYLSSARASNEDHFLFQKIASVFNGDSTAENSGVTRAPAGSIEEIAAADAVLVVGTDLTEEHPVIGYRVREAVRKGARLIAADSRQIDLPCIADFHLALRPGAETAFLKGMAGVITGERSAEDVSEDTGAAAGALGNAARIFSSAGKRVIICPAGEEIAGAAAVIAAVTGSDGKQPASLYILSAAGNYRGALDMGVAPPVIDGKTKIAFIMGEGPVHGGGADPEMLEFLVVLDTVMTEKTACADVMLPAASFAEKLATYTNSEGRVQLSFPAAAPPGEARAGWEVIVELARRIGYDWTYEGPEGIFREIASLVPAYSGMTYTGLAGEK